VEFFLRALAYANVGANVGHLKVKYVLLPCQLVHLCYTFSHIVFYMPVCRHSWNTAQIQILIDTLAGICDIHKITFNRNWYRSMPGGIMPLGYNFGEFVAINLYITSDFVII